MAIVGYDPLPNGGYRFHKDDGTAMSFMGPEADSLKQWVDQSRPPDQRMAQVDPTSVMAGSGGEAGRPPPQPFATDAGGMSGMSAPPQPAPIASMPQPAQPTPAPMARVASSPQVPAGAPPGPQRPPPSPGRVEAPGNPEKLPTTAGMGGPADESKDARAAVHEATDQLGLAIATAPPVSGPARPSKMMLTGQTVEGTTPMDQEANRKALETQQAGEQASLAEYRAAAEQKKAYFEQEGAAQAHAANAAHDQILDAQNHAAHVQQAWDQTYAGLQREQAAVANQKIDPKRLFSGDAGTMYAITSTLGVALGSAASSLTGGPNYAAQIVNASIQRDIDAQMDDVRRKGENANNAVANFMRAYGMQPEEAKLAVKSIGQQYAANLAGIQQAKLGRIGAQEEAAKFTAQMQNDSLKAMGEAQSKLQQRVSQTYKQSGGGGGGLTAKQQLENLNLQADLEMKHKKIDALDGGKGGKLSARLGATQAFNRSGQEDTVNLEKADPGGYIAPDLPGLPRTDARIALDTSVDAVISKVLAGQGEQDTVENHEHMKKNLADPRESVRRAARAAVLRGEVTADKYIEQQRGQTAKNSSGESDEQ